MFYIVSFELKLIFTAGGYGGHLSHNFKTINYGTAKTRGSKQNFRNYEKTVNEYYGADPET